MYHTAMHSIAHKDTLHYNELDCTTMQCTAHSALHTALYRVVNRPTQSFHTPSIIFIQCLYTGRVLRAGRAANNQLSRCLSVCVFVCPFSCVFFEASHWPSGHMTRSRPLIGQPSLRGIRQGSGSCM